MHILRGDFGSPIIVDYVVLETLLLLGARKLSHMGSPLLEFLRTNQFRIIFVTQEIFNDAIKLAVKKSNQEVLSLTDSSEIVVSRELFDSGAVATFDGPLGNFFEKNVGKGYFKQLSKEEKNSLMKGNKIRLITNDN